MRFKLTFTFLFISIFMLNNNFAQSNTPTYKKVEITINDDSDIQKVAESGIDLICGTHMEERGGVRFLQLNLSEYEYTIIQQKNLTTNILIEDLSRWHAERNVAALPAAITQLEQAKSASALKSANADPCEDREIPVPQNFNLGSMGGFTTYDELLADLDKMAAMYPNLITTKAPADEDILTVEGRQVFYVKVSDNPNEDEDEAEVLYTGLHHAREPISMMNLQYFLWVLLENYETNEYIKSIVDNTELYFIPVINPDGYVYNETTDPQGGGYWRKNLRDNGDGTIGVDLNRNYDYAWGQDNQGSSPNTNSNTYRGSAPFSEPETQIIRNFVLSRDFTMAFNNHTYSNFLLSPWGHTSADTPDYDLFEKLGEEMCKHNRYAYGGSNQLLYSTNGESDDWFYGEKGILAWTPEIGRDEEGGFWPSPDFIPLQAHRHLRMSLQLAESAANFGTLHDLTPYTLTQADAQLTFGVQHMSKVGGNLGIKVTSDNIYVQNISTAFMTAAAMESVDFEELTTSITIDSNTPDGTLLDFEVTLNNGIRDLETITITKEYNASIVFADDCSNLDNWVTDWAILDTDGYKENGCITDSPSGNSGLGKYNLVMSQAIDLTAVNAPVLEYYAKWEVSKFFDYVQVQISTDNASTWQDLCSENTKPGMFDLSFIVSDSGSEQPSNDPIYDGVQRDWIREQIDLSAYGNTSDVYLRFVIYGSFNNAQSDGFYLDDLTIYDTEPLSVSNENPINDNTQIEVYPNPTNAEIRIDWQEATNGILNIFDKTGRLIFTQNISQDADNLTFNSNELATGIYIIQLKSANNTAVKRFVKM